MKSGADQGFDFVPERGYEVDQVKLNGSPIGSMDRYDLQSVRSAHRLAVIFRRKKLGKR